MENDLECHRIGSVESGGKIVSCDLLIIKDSRPYILRLATPSYIEEIQRVNQEVTNQEIALDTNFYILNELDDPCSKISNIPTEEFKSFLIEQITPDD